PSWPSSSSWLRVCTFLIRPAKRLKRNVIVVERHPVLLALAVGPVQRAGALVRAVVFLLLGLPLAEGLVAHPRRRLAVGALAGGKAELPLFAFEVVVLAAEGRLHRLVLGLFRVPVRRRLRFGRCRNRGCALVVELLV